jgi:acetyltransferase-like isoleucine patch superfamily enzyme
VVEDNVWIGANSVITAGVTIGKNAIIGAGSVVTKNIPAYSVAVGNPARVIKQYNFETAAWERV